MYRFLCRAAEWANFAVWLLLVILTGSGVSHATLLGLNTRETLDSLQHRSVQYYLYSSASQLLVSRSELVLDEPEIPDAVDGVTWTFTSRGTQQFPGPGFWSKFQWYACGFGHIDQLTQLQHTIHNNGTPTFTRFTNYRSPPWPFLLVLGIPPAARAWQLMEKRRRRRNGLCYRCGYDLSHSPGRCPECGSGREGKSGPGGPAA